MASDIVTAAVLLIGDEILSGRTKDINAGFIAERLTELGIDLKEIRVVADEEPAIIEALNALRARYTYVFTTGGIGPTHDDITADAVANAFGVKLPIHPKVEADMRIHFADRLNEARLRMARVPEGGELFYAEGIIAPGFRIGNVFVMAGVPKIMQSMFAAIAPGLKTGPKVLSETILANAKEGDVGTPLGEIQKRHPETSIGSYPFQDERGHNTNLVIRARDPDELARVKAEVLAMLDQVHAEVPV
ncbi:molybdenum cofactor biosynthesis protein [Terrihabitans soli]|uniref:Molybdenum cofactor biosynthesis protein n=1 Tax=Terrihabitans soli TaxID=708113 RepID=A0A6S6QPA4_9HYPH|nr:molybdopterin-binding protein [Terrihabitans soli]BCJ91306.1 molybdenum cofactor biosynthesis protein [Terrihabitans soli]